MIGSAGDMWRQHLRLALLRILEKSPAFSANESVLHDAVCALGMRATRDQVRGELAWLAEQGLIEIEDLDGLQVATAKKRGVEVAQGLVAQPGIKRPSPRD